MLAIPLTSVPLFSPPLSPSHSFCPQKVSAGNEGLLDSTQQWVPGGFSPCVLHLLPHPHALQMLVVSQNRGWPQVPQTSPQTLASRSLSSSHCIQVMSSFASLWDSDCDQAPFISGNVFSPPGTRKMPKISPVLELVVFLSTFPGWQTS